jgi:hypothetical protein
MISDVTIEPKLPPEYDRDIEAVMVDHPIAFRPAFVVTGSKFEDREVIFIQRSRCAYGSIEWVWVESADCFEGAPKELAGGISL